jgi:hypothetical protein
MTASTEPGADSNLRATSSLLLLARWITGSAEPLIYRFLFEEHLAVKGVIVPR